MMSESVILEDKDSTPLTEEEKQQLLPSYITVRSELNEAEQRSIGVAAYRISADLRQLIDDCRYWVDHESYQPDEIAARFSHRLVHIHPFPNGNGRHSRIAADLLLVSLGHKRFTWGQTNLVDANETRGRYIDALHATSHQPTSLHQQV